MLSYKDESIRRAARLFLHYFDEIIDIDTVQDFNSVTCCLKSVIDCIKKQFPFVTRLTDVSDNVKCYSRIGLLGSLVALSITTGLRIERLLHTEAREWKSELDAHFGCSWAWLQRYLNAGNDLLKTSQIVNELRSYGGIPALRHIPQHCAHSTVPHSSASHSIPE